MPVGQIGSVVPLAGTQLQVGRARIRLGFPQVFPLVPAAHLRARLVTIKGFEEEEAFVAAVRRQLRPARP